MSEIAGGLLKLNRRDSGVLRDPARTYPDSPRDVHVPPELVRRYNLAEGAVIVDRVRQEGDRNILADVDTVCGLSPKEFKNRPRYQELVAVDPNERFILSATGNMSMRMVDLLAPIGKGTRGLIVSPPKSGKTTLLEEIAQGVRAYEPEARIIVLLIDERPEEVTHFRRAVDAEVFASTIDQSVPEHVELAELMLNHIRVELECGRDVVVLVDSLTRIGRAFNLRGSSSGRTLSGGVDAGALEVPRRFFGLARNIENGGSVTIIASALIDTGSRMDQVIFEEFKGTGNSEIVLDRTLAEARIFPAIDLKSSGTRKEARLYAKGETEKITRIRRFLSDRSPKEGVSMLLELMRKYPTNEKMLKLLPDDLS